LDWLVILPNVAGLLREWRAEEQPIEGGEAQAGQEEREGAAAALLERCTWNTGWRRH
jgi:hypothetical protein